MLSEHPVGVTVPVTDLARARKFYEGGLGLTVAKESETEVTYACGAGTTIEIFEAPTSGSERTLANWSVADIDAEVAVLTEAGVVFEHYDEVFGISMGDDNILRTPRGDAAWFRDPDGNLLLLSQPIA